MNFSEALRAEYKRRTVSGKYPKQRFVPEYKQLYPWIIEDEMDRYYAFCVICETRLSCKRGDLAKHESSNKHKTNSAKKEYRNTDIIQCVGQDELMEDYVFAEDEYIK